MKKSFKRGLAIAAVAPLAIIGVAGAAAADTDITEFNTIGAVAVANCVHDGYDETHDGGSDEVEELRVRLLGTLEDSGVGPDEDDIEMMSVTATDNQGDGMGANGFYEEHAKVSSITLKYYRFDDFDGIAELPSATYKRTYTDSARDGKVTNTRDTDNVDLVLADVRWYSVGEAGGGEAERLRCFAFLNDDFI